MDFNFMDCDRGPLSIKMSQQRINYLRFINLEEPSNFRPTYATLIQSKNIRRTCIATSKMRARKNQDVALNNNSLKIFGVLPPEETRSTGFQKLILF